MKRAYRILIMLLIGCLSACSSGPKPPPPEPDSVGEISRPGEFAELDVFAARGFLGGSDYERYHLKDRVLWRECGRVGSAQAKSRGLIKSLSGDDVFVKDPNLVLDQRRVETLPSAHARMIDTLVMELLEFERTRNKRHPLPGSVFALTGPGLMELKIRLDDEEHNIVTSVDAVTEEDSRLYKKMLELVEAVRGVGPMICESQTFFGIGRKEFKKDS